MGLLAAAVRKPTARRPLDDREQIDLLYKRSRLYVMLSLTIGYGFLYTTRLPLSIVKKPLIDAGIFSAEQLGVIGSSMFWAYAVGKCVNGFLADHANLRTLFAFGIFASALCCIGMGVSTSLTLWMLLWGLNGWVQGLGAPVAAVSLASWFTQGERGTRYGIWSTAHSIGEGLTFIGTSALVTTFGWRAGFLGPALLCVGVAIAIYFAMKDRPESLGLPPVTRWKDEADAPSEAHQISTGRLQLQVLKTPVLWVLCLSCAAMSITRHALNSWGMLYLQEARGYSLLQAGSILGVNTFAGILGCIAYGVVSDRAFKGRRPPVTLLFGLIEVVALCVIFFAPPGHPVLLTAAFAVYGFTLSGLLAVLGGLFAIDLVSPRVAGAAMGMIGIFAYVATGIQERVSGFLIERGTTMVDGVRHYDFDKVVLFWLGASVVSLVLATSLWRVGRVEHT